jgi:hypothetical protein
MKLGPIRAGASGRCAAFATFGLFTLSACGGLGGGAAKTVTVTASSSGNGSPTSALGYPSTGGSEPAGTETPQTAEPTDQGSASGPPVIRNSGSPKSLTLADVFDHDGWKEGLYQTPQSATPVQAMASENTCSTRRMEVRLAQATGNASIKVAQALDSRSSKVTVEFKLFADQRLVDTKLVKFNQVNVLSADVDGISALALEVKRADNSEECDATAVVTQFLLSPQ